MTRLNDSAVSQLRALTEQPDLSETRYELRELLGRGGMGTVYAATDRELGRVIALKVLNVMTISASSADRLRREARILAQLEHPNIIPIHDVGTLPDGRSFYTMKLVQGQRLDQFIAPGLPIADRLQVFERICDALAFAHARGVIHRDLKPSNIMVGPFGEVLVLDWGVAKADARTPPTDDDGAPRRPEPESTGSGSVVGTHGYMSPEQARGDRDVDARSDIYSLGTILLALVDAPISSQSVRAAPRRTRALHAIAARARSPLPEARYQSVLDLAAEIARFRDDLPVEAYRESLAERFARLAVRYQLPLTLVLAYVLMRLALLLTLRR